MLLLLRHAETRANRRGLWHGSSDGPLTFRGRRQLKKTVRRVARVTPPAAIYTSPAGRCLRLAEAAAEATDAELTVVDELREQAIGDWEGLSFSQLAKEHALVERTTADPHFAPPGGESLRDVADRIVPALRRLHDQHDPEERVLAVGHGVAFGIALGELLEEDPTRWADYRLANCSLTELLLIPGTPPQLGLFNGTFHLS